MASVNVATNAGLDLRWATLYNLFANAIAESGGTATQFTAVVTGHFDGNDADVRFIVAGSGFTYSGTFPDIELTGGTIDSVTMQTEAGTTLATFTGLAINGVTFITALETYAAGGPGNTDPSALNAIFLAFQYEATGGGGIDFLEGGNLSDTLTGGALGDTLIGGAGTDFASYQNAPGPMTADLATPANNLGHAQNDSYNGIEGLIGSNFNDSLRGNNNANTLIGGAGNDFLRGRGGADVLDGGAGGDWADYFGAALAVTVDLNGVVAGTNDSLGDTFISIENIRGGDGNDILIGDANSNFLRGGAGQDELQGGAGFDTADYLDATGVGVTADLEISANNQGEAQGDTYDSIENLRGSTLVDTLRGNSANNSLEGRQGADTLDGRGGNDEARYDQEFGPLGAVVVNLVTGQATDSFGSTDTLISIEVVRGTNSGDLLLGGNPNSYAFEMFRGLGGADSISGGDGYDELRYDLDATNGGAGVITVDLANGTVTDGFGAVDLVSGIQGVYGTAGGDSFTGNNFVGFFSDAFVGRGGIDSYVGGAGFDEVRFDQDASAGGTLGVTVNLANGTATDGFGNSESLVGIEAVRGTSEVDTLTGSAGRNAFRGLGGNDIFDGGGDEDEASYDQDVNAGGTLGVTVNLANGTATDGFGDLDTLISIENARGTLEIDTLIGSDADNSFVGLAGADQIDGGLGSDEVRYDVDFFRGGGTGVTVNLASGQAIDGFGNTDTLASIEEARGTRFNDGFTGNAANNVFAGLAGNDDINGEVGSDWVTYHLDIFNRDESQALAAVTVDLGAGTATDSYGWHDTLTSIENAAGGTLGDTLTGSAGDNIFRGLAGNDTINGLDGIDTVDYRSDRLYGESTFINGASGVTVNLGANTATDGFGNNDTLSSIENAIGTDFGDALTGSAVANVLTGGGGDDNLTGGGGNDVLNGGSGSDTAHYDESQASNTVVAFGSTVAVLDAAASEIDRLTGVETIQFSDGNVSTGPLSQFKAFDYLASYDDLIQVFGANETAGFEHYIANGFFEGRAADAFDGFQYLASYDDLIQVFGPNEAVAAQHFVANGFAEGRSRDAFDAFQYLASYDDLIQVFGPNETPAAQHFVTNGFGEGRSRDAFDGFQYLASYDDLIQAFGANETAAAQHFVANGFGEGRSRDAFDGFQYLASYGDLIQAFGPNETAAAQHFVANGFAEGRSRDDFDAAQYLANYADLQAAFGTNEQAATLHFIQFGYFEGRTDDLLP